MGIRKSKHARMDIDNLINKIHYCPVKKGNWSLK